MLEQNGEQIFERFWIDPLLGAIYLGVVRPPEGGKMTGRSSFVHPQNIETESATLKLKLKLKLETSAVKPRFAMMKNGDGAAE